MQTFVALLRGINVGKANRVSMAELRALLIKRSYSGVATLLNSGNAIFRAANGLPSEHGKAISAAISAEFGIEVLVIVKAAQELNVIVQQNPLDAFQVDPSQLLVAFVQEIHALKQLCSIESLAVLPEQFVVGENAAYLHCANGILESKAAKALQGKVGRVTTTRNWATVLKLQALMAKAGP